MNLAELWPTLVALVVIILVAQVLGRLCHRFGQPAVIGEIAGGILLGPTLFGGALTHAVFPLDVRPVLGTVADIGICVFMLMVGMHVSGSSLAKQPRVAMLVSLGSTAVPFVLGVLLALGIVGGRADRPAVLFCLFLGTAMSVTAFPVLARILTERGLLHTRIGDVALGAAAVGDVLAWSLLAVLVALSDDSGVLWRPVLLLPLVGLLVGVVRPTVAWLVARRPPSPDRSVGAVLSTDAALVIGLAIALWLSAQATAWMGLHVIFGAFLLGTVLPRTEGTTLGDRVLPWIERVNRIVLLPVYFVVAGLAVDLSTASWSAVGLFVLVLSTAVVGKFAGAFGTARLVRIPTRESTVLGVLLNTRGLTELIVLSVGRQAGLLDQRLYSLMVLMALVTTAMAGPLLSAVYPRWRVEQARRRALTDESLSI